MLVQLVNGVLWALHFVTNGSWVDVNFVVITTLEILVAVEVDVVIIVFNELKTI